MRYHLKQKILTLVDKFTVQDAMGRVVYWVEGEVALVPTIRILDFNMNELARIKRKALALSFTYEVYRGDTLLATVSKNLFALFGPRYTIRIANGEEVIANGDFFAWNYTLTWRDIEIASIHTESPFPDTYAVDVTDGHDPIPILAIAIIFDLCHAHRSSTMRLLLGR